MASDEDTTPFFYALDGDSSRFFEIDPQTGVIVTLELLDYEQIQEYPNLQLIVFDADLLHDNASFRFVIEDENDNSPTFANDTVQIFVPELTSVGSEIFIAMATDLDDTSNALLTYSISGSAKFTINPLSGAIIVDSELDFEMQQNYTLEVRATDGGNPARSSLLTLSVQILDQNDNAPVITNPMPRYSVRENLNAGELIGAVGAIDADSGENAVISFEITAGNEASNFFIDRVTGNISTNATIDREEESVYYLTVEVSLCKAYWKVILKSLLQLEQ